MKMSRVHVTPLRIRDPIKQSGRTLIKYRVYSLIDCTQKQEATMEKTMRSSFHCDDCKFSKNGRFIVILEKHRGSKIAIIDTVMGQMKETYTECDNGTKYGTSINVHNRFCLFRVWNRVFNGRLDRFLDLRTGEFVGSAMVGELNIQPVWLNEDLILIHEKGAEKFLISVHQPQMRIPLKVPGFVLAATDHAVFRAADQHRYSDGEILIGHWERD